MRKLHIGIVAISSGNAPVSTNVDIIRELFDDLSPSISQSDLPPAITVHSLANQIEFVLQPGKTEIKEMSPELPFNSQFPKICANVLSWLTDQGVEWRSHGWNIAISEAIREQTSGELTAGLLSESVLALGRELRGASVALNYTLDDANVKLTLEPRFGKFDESEVFISANYHYGTIPPLKAADVRAVGGSIWEDFVEVVRTLGGGDA